MFSSSMKPPPRPFTARGSSSFARDPSDSHASPSSPPPPPSSPSPSVVPSYYRPSIYSYTCRGAWFVSSSDPHSEGRCRGIRSRLELLADMDDSTRDVAIKNFTFMTDYDLDEDDPVDPHHGGSGSGAPGGNGLNQKTKSILISPALIYKEKVEPSTAATRTPNGEEENQPPHPPRRPAIEMPVPAPSSSSSSSSSTALPEEELIKRQRWSCYGSTEVELLVLQNVATGTEHIAAVAPRNVGVSVRKIDADDGSITSIGIGWLNIVVDAGPSFLDDDDEEDDDHDRASSQHNPSRSPGAKPLDGQQRQQSATADKRALPDSPSLSQTPEEIPPRPSQDSIARARTQLKKFYEFTGKVGEQMRANVTFLKDTAQDDFVRRSIAAGHRIIDHVPRTVDRTATFLQKMLDRWSGGGGDGAGGDGGPGERGPGP